MSTTSLIKQADAVIFDLDGVLVDTAVFHFKAWQRLAKSFGFNFTTADNEQLKGISRMDSLDLIINWAKLQPTSLERLAYAEQKNIWYLELVEQMTKGEVLPGCIELLDYLRRSGKKVALGSASKNAKLILNKTGIIDYFDAIVDGNAVTHSKPDPEVFLLGARQLGVVPEKCLVFEDAQAGIQAAKSAGMNVIAVDRERTLTSYDARLDELTEIEYS
ncbi:MAG: beta-phosphoglucomutase [Sphingobacterium sp.]|uniref:beta-phosphoglucomutase n=1 Tax=Sphingobacterium sp. JB170 TaxID=1434842 RepID=UPI00097F4DE2|nr:beta-phosphoglucomutase [Sphingobacterium sp. JB170]SJN35544.1 Beta-phosphoglucomutase [Sphingobacterium sp. JB170]